MISIELVFNRRHQLDKNGHGLIHVRSYQDRKYKYYSTGIKILPKDWNEKKKVIKASCPNYQEYNQHLTDLLNGARKYILDLGRDIEGNVNINHLDRFFHQSDHKDFLQFFANYIKESKLSKASNKHYSVILSILKQYKASIRFSELNYDMVQGFEQYLISKEVKRNSINHYHKVIKVVINAAIKKDYFVGSNPYNKYTIRQDPIKRVFLTQKELSKLESFETPGRNYTYRAKLDLFLFGCYTGLRYSDIIRLDQSNFELSELGYTLNIKSKKTGKFLSLPLWQLAQGKANLLIKKYIDKKDLFGSVKVYTFNKAIQDMAKTAGIDKKVTSHVARRTFANLIAQDLDLRTRQLILQHSNIATTEKYLSDSNEQIKLNLERAAKKREAKRILLEKLKDTDLPPDLLDVFLD